MQVGEQLAATSAAATETRIWVGDGNVWFIQMDDYLDACKDHGEGATYTAHTAEISMARSPAPTIPHAHLVSRAANVVLDGDATLRKSIVPEQFGGGHPLPPGSGDLAYQRTPCWPVAAPGDH